jgi:ABC-type multidrug transport system fused ATPase/permease subunit
MKLRIGTSKEYLKRIPHALGEHAFLFTLFLIALAGGISALVFFFFVLSSKPGEIETQAKSVELRKDVFEKILEIRNGQDKRLQESKTALPKDIFRLNR